MMRKKTIFLLITATALVLAGCILFGGMMMALGWDFTKLGTEKFETNTHEMMAAVNKIAIKTNTANIVFLPTDDEVCKVVCYEGENNTHSVTVTNGCLAIRLVNEKKWYDYIGIQFGTPKITVYLPRGIYESVSIDVSTGHVEIPKDFQFIDMDITGSTGDVTIMSSVCGMIRLKTGTGDITVCDISAGSIDLNTTTGKIVASNVVCDGDVKLQVSTGKVALSNVTCKNLTTTGNTGKLSLDHVIASEKLVIYRTTGDVKFEACDAAEMFIQTDTGDVTGTLLSDKTFQYKTSTGKVELPQNTAGGKCEINTSTGNIRLKIVK